MPTLHRPRPSVVLTGVVVALIGLALTLAGAHLATLGGSFYYLAAGLAMLATGGLLVARKAAALWLYAAVVLGTILWSVWEIGFDLWSIAPRGDIVFLIGLWLLMPWITAGLRPVQAEGRPALRGTPGVPALAAALGLGVVYGIVALLTNTTDLDGSLPRASASASVAGGAQVADGAAIDMQGASAPQPDADWQAYGRTGFGDRYSPLTQVTPGNVKDLKVAWVFRTGDLPGKQDPTETTDEVTPIKVGDTVYLCSPHQIVFALDAATGKLKWRFDPHVQDNPTFQHLTCRGVSYHAFDGQPQQATPAAAPAGPDQAAPAPAAAPAAVPECPRRIYIGVNDARLIALDADTGKPCDGFGDRGTVNLNTGMPVTTAGFYEPTSPPVVTNGLVIINGSVIDNYSTNEPSGVIRAYDAETGKLVWAWDSGAQDENALPENGHLFTKNSPNSWITMSVDEKLGLVYVPTGVSTPDIWGGNRDALSERFASSVVALDVKTGKRVWAYQTVHHDLWDMDVPSQVSLVDLQTDHGVVPALYAPAKTGNIFVLDRRTGQPIVPAPETPVPQGAAPGDRLSPTQPFSQLSFRPRTKLTGADMWGATMFDQLACRIMFHQLDYRGPFTPPSLKGTLVFPGNLGMFEWGGIAVDPIREIAIANPMAIPFVSKLIPRGPNNPAAPNNAHPSGSEVGVQPQYGVPYGVVLHPFLSPLGLPCKRPPWGYMAGIDLRTNKIVWQHKNGTIRDSSPVPVPIKMGVPTLGGPLVTRGGVAFLTSTLDYYIRAYDVTTGKQLWQDRLPAGGQSTPMSYAVGGRQFIVTADGGHGSFGTKLGDYVIAYSLPDAK